VNSFSYFISSDSIHSTHLKQTFQNPRIPILCPILSLETPNATAITFGLMRRFQRIRSSLRFLMKLITCSHRSSTMCFVTQICLPQFSIFEPPDPSILLYSHQYTDLHKRLASSVNFNLWNFSHG
jgi:hypothetical protein